MNRLLCEALDRFCIFSMRTFMRDRFREIDRSDTDRALADLSDQPRDLFGEPVEPFDLLAAASDEPDCQGMRYRTIRYTSPHAAQTGSDHPNNTVTAHLLSPKGEPAVPSRVLVALHGYRQATWKLFFLPFARYLSRHGWSMAVMELPHHLSRRAAGDQNGERMVCASPIETLRGISQAVVDARVLTTSFRHAGSNEVGVVGASLGGLIASLVGLVESELDHLMLVIPAVDPGDVLWNCGLLRDKRRAVEMAGYDEDDVRRMVGPITPANFKPAVAAENVLLIQSRYDLIARAPTIARFCETWGICRLRTLNTGHFLLALLSNSLRPEILNFLQRDRASSALRNSA